MVTGAAGYIGGIIVDELLKDRPETNVIGIDLLPEPERWIHSQRVTWIQADLATDEWQNKALVKGHVDAVVHCAFRIRTPFGKVKAYEKNNRAASANTFKFAFDNKVGSIVYLSSVSAYGARKENIGRLLKESEPFLELKNPYGYQKKLIEDDLLDLIERHNPKTRITVLRLNSVTGPRSQSLSSKFGLITFLKKLLPFVIELDPHWARQFVHEDDVADAIFAAMARSNGGTVEIYNIAPKQFLEVRDIARTLNKKVVRLPAWTVQAALFLLWPISFGKLVPASATSGLVYPINVDGSAIERALGFKYHYTAEEALLGKIGRHS